MTDRSSIDIRLRALKEYVGFIKGIRQKGIERVRRDPYLEAALYRYLHLAIEAALDIGELLIAGRGWVRPETNREVLLILGEKGILKKDFAVRFSTIAGLRNILVHDYLKVDLTRVFQSLTDVGDFDQFARRIARLLK